MGATTPKVSQTQLDAIAHARRGGGKLHRHAGGYWNNHPTEPPGLGVQEWFGTQTIKAMVRHGLAVVSRSVTPRNKGGGPFMVEVTITEDAANL